MAKRIKSNLPSSGNAAPYGINGEELNERETQIVSLLEQYSIDQGVWDCLCQEMRKESFNVDITNCNMADFLKGYVKIDQCAFEVLCEAQLNQKSDQSTDTELIKMYSKGKVSEKNIENIKLIAGTCQIANRYERGNLSEFLDNSKSLNDCKDIPDFDKLIRKETFSYSNDLNFQQSLLSEVIKNIQSHLESRLKQISNRLLIIVYCLILIQKDFNQEILESIKKEFTQRKELPEMKCFLNKINDQTKTSNPNNFLDICQPNLFLFIQPDISFDDFLNKPIADVFQLNRIKELDREHGNLLNFTQERDTQ